MREEWPGQTIGAPGIVCPEGLLSGGHYSMNRRLAGRILVGALSPS
jgi:hypothetical protein